MWIIVAIAAYFVLAFALLIDKYLLAGPIGNPKLYAVAIALLGSVVFLLVPFGFFEIPSEQIAALGIAAGVLQFSALLALFYSLKKFEASRIVPAVGALLPMFTLFMIIALGRHEILEASHFLSFALLVSGSVLVSATRGVSFTVSGLLYSAVTALLFALFVIVSKFVYEEFEIIFGDETLGYLGSLIWIAAGMLASALLLLAFSPALRREMFSFVRESRPRGSSFATTLLFVGNQGLAGVGFLMQNWAIALAPFAFVAFVNALEGIKFAFVFLLAAFFTIKFPSILKEELSRTVVIQKIAAIILIGAGLLLLAEAGAFIGA